MSLRACEVPLGEAYDLVLLDLDGVVYVGADAVPGAAEALDAVRAAPNPPRLAFVTNNASRPPGAVGEHLRDLGVTCDDDDVVTSAQAAAALLAGRLAPGSRVLVVGGAGIRDALVAEGLTPVGSMDEHPQAVVQGFSPDIGWKLLAEGTRAVRSGLPWIATNTDLTVPTPYGPAPGNGTLVAAVATASGVLPEVAGKPQPPLFLQAAARYGSSRPLVVGDRLDTDIEGAVSAGMPSLLVLTGVTDVPVLLAATPGQRPNFVAEDLAGLLVTHPATVAESGGWRCRDAAVRAGAAGPEVVSAGTDPLDLLRAACAAEWEYRDANADGAARDESQLRLHLADAGGGEGPWARYGR